MKGEMQSVREPYCHEMLTVFEDSQELRAAQGRGNSHFPSDSQHGSGRGTRPPVLSMPLGTCPPRLPRVKSVPVQGKESGTPLKGCEAIHSPRKAQHTGWSPPNPRPHLLCTQAT